LPIGSDSAGEPSGHGARGRWPDISRLGAVSGGGAVLNAAKFLVLPAFLGAHALDVLAVGVLLAITVAQTLGEPVANHAVVHPGASRTRAAAVAVTAAVIAIGLLAPAAILALLAPGFETTPTDRLAVRIFAVTGVVVFLLWAVAGRLQQLRDFTGLGLLAVVPNVGLVVGAVTGSIVTVAASMLALTALALGIAVRRRRRARPIVAESARAGGPTPALIDLLALSVATQLNLILIRVACADLPPGSLGAMYVAVGAATFPVSVVAAAAASVSLPHWRAGDPSRPLHEAGRVALLATALSMIVGGSLISLCALPVVRDAIDPGVRDGVLSSLPILACGAPIYAAAWFLRSLVIARGGVRLLAGLAAAGALAVPGSRLIGDTLEVVSVGYLVSPVPWLIGAILIARRPQTYPAVQGRRL